MSAWQNIRLLRSIPPGLAQGDEERTAVFTAALEQSEQLMRAAEAVGHAARPLPLFYSLSQAGRAIAAARLNDPAWRLRLHGLTVGDAPPHDLLRTMIVPQPMIERKRLESARTDSFSGVAAAVGSDLLTESIELGEIWAAVPDLLPGLVQLMPGLERWRRPRVVYDEYDATQGQPGPEYPPWAASLLIGGLREGMTEAEINEELSWYPALAGAKVRTNAHLGDPETGGDIMRVLAPDGQPCATVRWPGPWETQPKIDDVAPAYRRTGIRLVIPKLSTGDYLAPIMLWWALLIGLSSIARYQPGVWVSALDLNSSRQAVPIEDVLDVALTAVPGLILLALVDQ